MEEQYKAGKKYRKLLFKAFKKNQISGELVLEILNDQLTAIRQKLNN